MKKDIHPKYEKCMVTCTCGNAFETRSTTGNIRTSVCSACHPYYTGKKRFVSETGRVERFQAKYKNVDYGQTKQTATEEK